MGWIERFGEDGRRGLEGGFGVAGLEGAGGWRGVAGGGGLGKRVCRYCGGLMWSEMYCLDVEI